MSTLRNPLLPGFYPDPSVCRKGDDYYLVTSSFEYFPGIPIFHSRDFVHWHQIGHVLTRKSQANLDGLCPSRGIYAATIRYSEETDTFYVVTTLVGNAPYYDNINFYVTASDPTGPWSDPVIIKGAEGIDPTLVFDGDEVYYLGNKRPNPDIPECESRHIWLQRLDLPTGTLVGERVTLLEHGALYDAVAPEGPHLYHIKDWYYLIIAEGGTDHNHCSTVFRSRSIFGPYECNPRNPLITHRNFKRDYPINSTGHADILELNDGSWWAVLLASRPDGGDYRNLGRETFAVPMVWEDDWPVFSPQTGCVEFSYSGPDLPECIWEPEPACDHFLTQELGMCWNILRTPDYKTFSLNDRPGFLRLYLNCHTLAEVSSPAFIGRRQQHMCFTARTYMEFIPAAKGEAAGITMFYNNQYFYSLMLQSTETGISIVLTCQICGDNTRLYSAPYENNGIYFKIRMRYQSIDFYFSQDGQTWIQAGTTVSGTILNKETAGGFTGTYIALYATADGKESQNYADFDWFEYTGEIN